jgi:hypothetical protein
MRRAPIALAASGVAAGVAAEWSSYLPVSCPSPLSPPEVPVNVDERRAQAQPSMYMISGMRPPRKLVTSSFPSVSKTTRRLGPGTMRYWPSGS